MTQPQDLGRVATGKSFRSIAQTGIAAVIAGALLRPGPLDQQGTPSQAHDGVLAAQAEAGPAHPA